MLTLIGLLLLFLGGYSFYRVVRYASFDPWTALWSQTFCGIVFVFGIVITAIGIFA